MSTNKSEATAKKADTAATKDGSTSKKPILEMLPGERVVGLEPDAEPHAIFGSFGGKPLMKHTSRSYSGGGDTWEHPGGKSYVTPSGPGEKEYIVDYELGKKKSYERVKREQGSS